MLFSKRLAYRNTIQEMTDKQLKEEIKPLSDNEKINKSLGNVVLTEKLSVAEMEQREKLAILLVEQKQREKLIKK